MKNQYERDLTVNQSSLIIESIDKLSIAEELGLQPGDKILTINECSLKDDLDFIYLTSTDSFTITIEKGDSGEIWEIEIEKDEDENLGINLKDTINTKTCQNHCLFCFIDQMPAGMRESLYIKDDDERLSFLNGNYVTLTNLSDNDIDRICRFKIPINISVHTTDLKLRRKLLGNINASKILEQLKKLKAANVEMNAQIVLVPDLNDESLERTIQDLTQFIPELQSVSVVPVGITKYRNHLFKIRSFTQKEALKIINLIETFQAEFKELYQNPFVYASDEFYLLAKKDLPEEEIYGEFNQLENGVGMVRSFVNDFRGALSKTNGKISSRQNSVLVTGKLFEPILKNLVIELTDKFPDIKTKVVGIDNNFFGPEITVTGLLTGQDIISRLKKEDLSKVDVIFLPETVLRNNTEILLDDITVTELEKILKTKIKISQDNGKSLFRNLIGEFNE